MTIDQLPTLTDPTGDVYFPVNKNGADYKLPTGGVAFYSFNADSVGTSITFVNGTRAILVTAHNPASDKSMHILGASSTAIGISTVFAGSNITVSGSGLTLTVTDSARTCNCLLIVWNGRVTIQ